MHGMNTYGNTREVTSPECIVHMSWCDIVVFLLQWWDREWTVEGDLQNEVYLYSTHTERSGQLITVTSTQVVADAYAEWQR